MNTTEKYKLAARQAIKLALPIVAGQLGIVLMGFFDVIQVGGLGAVYIGACGVANSVYFLFILLGMGTLFAVSPLVSESFGIQKPWKSIGVLRSAFYVAAALSAIFYVVILLATRYFSVLGETAHVTDLARRFLHLLNYSTPMLMFFTAGKQYMDGTGRTKVSMVITLLGLVMNVSLNQVLIYGKLGLPAMGIEGAAIATGISRTAMCLMICVFIWRDKQVRGLISEYRINRAEEQISYVPHILRIGIPSGLQMFYEVAAFGAAQIMSGWLGEITLSAYQVAINMASITFMMVSGLAAAGTIMTGYAYGARDREGIKIAGVTVYGLTLCSQLLFALIFLLFNHQLPKIYTSNTEVISIASALLILAAWFQLSDGFQVVGAGLLRGLQDTRVPSFIALASYWLLMVPLSYLLTFTLGFGVKGIWIAFVIGLSAAALLMFLRFRHHIKHLVFPTDEL
jgi:MATE family multidrug resistance protein